MSGAARFGAAIAAVGPVRKCFAKSCTSSCGERNTRPAYAPANPGVLASGVHDYPPST